MLALLSSSNDSGGGAFVTLFVIYIAFVVLMIVALWKIFTKAGEAGWKSIVPIYNFIIELRIIGRPWWWILLFFIPIVNLIMWIIVSYDLARSFGKGAGFAVGMIFLPFIFVPILGFGPAAYLGPAGPSHPQSASPPAYPQSPPPPSATPPPPPPPA